MPSDIVEPISVPWTMKPLDSAETRVDYLSDGRVQFGIVHDIVHDVNPRMLLWWFNNMIGDVTIDGQTMPRYRAWHPIDHVAIRYARPADDGANMGPGARVHIREYFQARADYRVDVVDTVTRLDEGGFTHINYRAGIEVLRMEYTFEEVEGGTLYKNCLIAGMRIPVIRGAFNTLVRPRVFSDAMGHAWVRHNIEEVGNLEFFLPELYDHCLAAD